MSQRRLIVGVSGASAPHLPLETVTLAGGVIAPPVPAFYHQPATIEDLLAHTAGKILDQFDIDHELFRRWSGPARRPPGEKPGNDA